MSASTLRQVRLRRAAAVGKRREHLTGVYVRLRELVVRGHLAPGTRLIEMDLAMRLGVSRTPLRAALQRLRQEGYLVDTRTAQQSRLTVAPMTTDDANELFHLVGSLEALAAREAAHLADGRRSILVADLEVINQELCREAKARHPDYGVLLHLDERFHRRYVEAGAGPRLLAMHDAVKPQVERYERLYVSLLMAEMSTSVQEHQRIARAIGDGRARDAHDAVHRNWRNAAARLGKVIERAGARGAW